MGRDTAAADDSGPASRAARVWLTPAEQRAWRSYLDATQLLFTALDQQLSRDAGISHPDYEVLVRLSESPDHSMRMRELAERTFFSRSRLSHAVSRLESLGWVAREPCDTDRRGTLARLTDDGYAKLQETAPGHARTVRRAIFDHLDAAQLANLEAVADIVRAAAPAAAGSDARPPD